jgi:hypothetical protein
MDQLHLKYHPILTAKEIFAANKEKFPHAVKTYGVMKNPERMHQRHPIGANIQNFLIWRYAQIYPKVCQLGDLRIGKRVTSHIEIAARILTALVEELVK